ncbi:hypothetical protein JYU14_02395 [Simkania negevensis]|uniref:GP-PDE domain-containing protein n=1 Tax=Simkania negevensis TaxID=83561 RepID=A0ABS3AS12_9BACT|nr:hypothetical protein [Simkania negevensis]
MPLPIKEPPHILTHRGLEPDQPRFYSESSFEAFQDQITRGYGLEFDPNFTQNGIVVWHDTTANRLTGGKERRNLLDIPTEELLTFSLNKGRLCSLNELFVLIKSDPKLTHALHLKGSFQTPHLLERLADLLTQHKEIIPQLIIFDLKPKSASFFKKRFPQANLAAAVAHPYDIERFNTTVGGTLLFVDELLQHKDLYNWAWLDEWDRKATAGKRKTLYTKEIFTLLRSNSIGIALVSPELHASSPGLLGGECHEDAKNMNSLQKRMEEIVALQPNFICTDFPQRYRSLTEQVQ